MKKCIQCEGEIKSKWAEKFCSRSCSATFNNKIHKKKESVLCKYCNEPMVDKRGDRLPNQEYHRDCKPKRTYAERRKQTNEAWWRYQMKKSNQTPLDADLEKIKEIYYNCPEGHEVDHIIPISKGGLHHQDNLQYLTISENRRKSNKLVGRP